MDEAWVMRFLTFHGYLGEEGSLDDALRDFQATHDAPVTARLNYQTRRLMHAYRCPLPDRATAAASAATAPHRAPDGVLVLASRGPTVEPEIHVDISSPPDAYCRIPARWRALTLGYSLVGACPAGLGDAGWSAIRSAFATWTASTTVELEERAESYGAELRALWTPGRAADPASLDPFHGPGGRVAIGYYPYPFLGGLAGDLHFDTSETWTTRGDGSGLDVETVALHEIGHCLGLGHSRDPASIMYSIYKNRQRELDAADCAEFARHYAGVV